MWNEIHNGKVKFFWKKKIIYGQRPLISFKRIICVEMGKIHTKEVFKTF